MLPGVAGRGKVDVRRAAKIAEALANETDGFDIVCLQEVFTESSRDIFRSELAARFPHQIPRCCPPSRFWTASGLFFASRFPIVSEPRFEIFREYAALSSDVFAMKGIFGVQIDVSSALRSRAQDADAPPERVHAVVLNTHLQSMPIWRNHRLLQLDQIRRFFLDELDGLSAMSTAAFLCGDMNISGEVVPSTPLQPTAAYAAMQARLATTEDTFRTRHPHDPGFTWDGADNAWIPTFPASSGDKERLDYILSFPKAPDPVSPVDLRRLTCTDAAVEKFGHDRTTRLSDHFGVSATLSLTR